MAYEKNIIFHMPFFNFDESMIAATVSNLPIAGWRLGIFQKLSLLELMQRITVAPFRKKSCEFLRGFIGAGSQAPIEVEYLDKI